MLKKVRIFDMQVGMYVVDTGLSWLDHPYLYCTEGPIESEEQIKAIRADGYAEAFIETDKDSLHRNTQRVYDKDDVERALSNALRDGFNLCKNNKNTALADEFPVAVEIHAKAMASLATVMREVSEGKKLDVSACLESSEEIAASVSRNRDALIGLSILHDPGTYLIRHGASVSILASSFGNYLGLSRPQVVELAIAGLLHDLGKAKLPTELLEKPGKLTQEEHQEMTLHPAHGAALLSTVMPDAGNIHRAVAEHHERQDGSGYPRGLRGSEQSLYGRILAIADVFGAITQARPYRGRLLPDKAMSTIYSQRKKDFDPGLLERFIKCLGVYPAGSLVRLTSGECAVVSQSNPATPLRPKVGIIFDQEMTPIHPVQMDLSGREGPAPAKSMDVQEIVDHRLHSIRMQDFFLL
ncbi:MAG: HD-GYP domain-containing protein [Desulfovibrio sp.]|nr:HD-GYP domain-containing protein [Desulfovibrio sp.]MBI4959781.1 HD-GYP domain-containing protein [Desulfovibrio sp.]